MASQISHIIYAKKYLDGLELGEIGKNLPADNGKIKRDEFLLGSVFPDIRRLEPKIRRTLTHLHFPELNLNFTNLTSFSAGWKFHLYCDMKREEILNKYEFYSLKNTTNFSNFAAKILEDELVYEKYNNWEKLVGFFNRPPFPNIAIEDVTPETFNLWYAVLAKYIEKKPSDKSMRIFLRKQPSLTGRVDQIMESISILRKNKKVVEILKKVSEEIV